MDIGFFGWIILGFIAGALSGAVVGGRTARGCLPNVIVGNLGAIVGGFLARQMGFGQVEGSSRPSSSRSSARSSFE
jgi:uncharacterized membrane protein YeaQ/YmgE (transglycosylase-associated protein family)